MAFKKSGKNMREGRQCTGGLSSAEDVDGKNVKKTFHRKCL